MIPEPIALARIRLARSHPYLSAAIWSLQVVESKTVTVTAAVDNHARLYFNPDRLNDWTVKEWAGVLYHEVGHLLRNHHGRAADKAAEHERWNVAGDLEINDDLATEGVALPQGCVYPKTFKLPDGLMAEEYYDKLEGTAGEGPNCGSVAGGPPGDYELPGPGGDVPGLTKAAGELLRRSVAEAVKDHIRSRGNVPGGWERWADSVLNPTIPWQNVLRAAIRGSLQWAAGNIDHTYRKPSRRQHTFPDVILPSMHRPVPQIAVVIDTSGSIADQELAIFQAELKGILRASGLATGITTLSCDTKVHNKQRISNAAKLRAKGGGGTDMQVGVDAAYDLSPRPQVCIVLTDGYTGWGNAKPGMRVIVASTTDRVGPDWATTVHIK